jgi:hypothetical protein
LITRLRRFPGTVVALLAIGIAMVLTQPAASSTGQAGPVKVSVTPTSGLSDGQAVAIHVEADQGSEFYDVRAHLCSHAAGIKNTAGFDRDGPYCPPSAVSVASESESGQSFPPNTTTGDITFHVGVGTSDPWTDFFGDSHQLTCGPTNACDLVVQVQVPGSTVFATTPLCFGAACPPDPGAAPPPPPPAAPGASGGADASNQAAPKSDTAGAPGTASGPAKAGSASGPASPKSDTNAAKPAAGSTSALPKPGATSRSSSTDDATTVAAAPAVATTAATVTPIQGWRIALAGLAGLLCGARIVMILARALRRPAAVGAG